MLRDLKVCSLYSPTALANCAEQRGLRLTPVTARRLLNCQQEHDTVFPASEVVDEEQEICPSSSESDVELIDDSSLQRVDSPVSTHNNSSLKAWEKHINSVCSDTARIFIENNVDDEGPPQNFFYTNEYIAGEGVSLDTKPVIGCECTNCLKEKSSCCGHMSGSLFAYTARKLVDIPPCCPIYECNSWCRCGPECPNRVVQLGRKQDLCIFRTSDGRGWGVKAVHKIKKGTFVMEYVGEVITEEEYQARWEMSYHDEVTYMFALDYPNAQNPLTIDTRTLGNICHFVNHSCDPNLSIHAVWVNNSDVRLPRVALFAARDIDKGEELLFDYMMSGESSAAEMTSVDTGNSYRRKVLCKCRATNCRVYLY